MSAPEITTHEQILRSALPPDRELSVRVARLSVLFEDLRLESTAARCVDAVPQVDTIGKNYRYFYFLRRMVLTLDEFASALHQINCDPEWKNLRRDWDQEKAERWDSAVRFFNVNRPKWQLLRDTIGGHFQEKAARFAVANLRPGSTGAVDVVVYRDKETAGIRLPYVEEIVAVSLKQLLGPGQHSDEELSLYLNGLFTLLMEAVNEAVKAVHVVAVAFILGRFATR